MYAARRCAQAASLPAERQRTIRLAIDRSASMLPHQRSGALHALLEVMIGVNGVYGATRAMPVWAMSPDPEQIRPDLTADSLPGYVDTTLGGQALTSGTALAPLVGRMPAARGRETVYVITDDVPPDLDDAAAALRARTDTPALTWHLLLLASDWTEPGVRAEPWRDELRPLAHLVGEGLLTASAIAPDDRPGWLTDRLAPPDVLDAVVGRLVQAPVGH
jgi:hypothetical protein